MRDLLLIVIFIITGLGIIWRYEILLEEENKESNDVIKLLNWIIREAYKDMVPTRANADLREVIELLDLDKEAQDENSEED